MNLEVLSRLEAMYADVHPAALAEIYQWFPEMAKALREAREDAHKHREDALAWMQASFAYQRERDEARAEVARLREVLRQVQAQAAKGNDPTHGWVDQDLREIHKITEESP